MVLAETSGGPEVVVDGGLHLIDAVDPAAIGMEDDVARSRTGAVVGEEVGFAGGQVAGLVVDGED